MTRLIARIVAAATTSVLVGCATLPLQPTKTHSQPPITARTLPATGKAIKPGLLAGTTGKQGSSIAFVRGRASVTANHAF